MFNFIKKSLSKIYSTCTSKFDALFSYATIDEESLKELGKILIEADAGVATTKKIVEKIRDQFKAGTITDSESFKKALHDELVARLVIIEKTQMAPVKLLVGINGSGKTTLAAKLASLAKQEGKQVLLVAADTFRAAAQEQLAEWAKKLSIDIVLGKSNQDPASVVFSGCQKFKQEKYQELIIDTAGRLQTKVNLMKELEKIKRIISLQLPDLPVQTLLTVDSMLGQNSLEQARIFHESTKLDGIVLTKMDGTGKGGIVFAIAQELKIPVLYITFGEHCQDIKIFDPIEYVNELLNESDGPTS